MDFDIIFMNLSLLKSGLWLTIQLTVISVLIGIFLAIFFALFRLSNYRLISQSIRFYIYCIRGTPLLIQLFLIYYGLAQFDFIQSTFLWEFLKNPYLCALAALVLNTSAYGAEIIRGGIERMPKMEIEAANAYGLSKTQTYVHIIFPSVIRRILPTYFNEVILMLHATSLVSTITLVDLTGAARIINTQFYAPFEAFISVGLIYLLLTISLVSAFYYLEKKVNPY